MTGMPLTPLLLRSLPLRRMSRQERGRVGRWGRGNSVVPASGRNRISDHFPSARGVLPRLEVAAAGVYPHWGDGNSDLRALRRFEDQPEHGKYSWCP